MGCAFQHTLLIWNIVPPWISDKIGTIQRKKIGSIKIQILLTTSQNFGGLDWNESIQTRVNLAYIYWICQLYYLSHHIIFRIIKITELLINFSRNINVGAERCWATKARRRVFFHARNLTFRWVVVCWEINSQFNDVNDIENNYTTLGIRRI